MVIRRTFARGVLRLARWKTIGDVPRSGIMVGAPHTSNWDWVAMLLLLWSGSVPPRVLIKRQLFRGPLGWLLKATGGIPIDRGDAGAVVGGLAERAASDDSFVIVIAAEGTREKQEYWKSGFYRLARDTGLPVSLGFIDGPSRTIGFGPTLELSGDVAADMDIIRAFYADKRGVHPAARTEPRLRGESGTG
ncbi:MAG: 1-acyl-sn-glycerol-3-phosphate acyltransferase [Nocardioidaceae bacterium]